MDRLAVSFAQTLPAPSPSLSPEYLAESNAARILAVTGVFGALALITVITRLYVRGAMLRFTGSDDLVLAGSMLFGIAVYICFVGEVANGLGRHYQVIHQAGYLHWIFAHSLFSLFGIAMVKISVCLLLLRLVPHQNYRRFLWTIGVFLTVYTIACAFTIIFACIPVSANWDTSLLKDAKCFSIRTFTGLGITNSVFTMLTDAILAILPIPIVMNLQLNMRTKIALSLVLSLGFIAVACGAVKIFYQYNFQTDPDSAFNDHFFVWAALELYLGIIACSLPPLRPLMTVVLKSAKSRYGNGTGERTPNIYTNRQSRGHRNRSELASSASETALKTGVTTTVYNREIGITDEEYFGVDTAVSYNVGIERSDSESIPMSNLQSPHTIKTANYFDGADRNGIMRTTKVVTHTENVAPSPLHKTPASSVEDGSSVNELNEFRPSGFA